MADCNVIFAIGTGADEPLNNATIKIRRIQVGTKGNLEVLSAWEPYVLNGELTAIPLVQGVDYEATVMGVVDGDKAFRVPAVTEVYYKDLVRLFPLPAGENFGPQGVGVVDAVQDEPGQVSFALTDGSLTTPIDLPQGEPGPNSIPTAEFMGSELADPSSPAAVAVSAKIGAGPWKANTAYTAGTVVQNPDGQLVQAKVDFTSGASYSPTNWKLPTGFDKAITRLGRCWILVATGQSNNTMADTGYPTGVTDPRICRYTASTGITTMSSSEVTLTAQLARELIRVIPPSDWILVVQAAVGSTQLTEGSASVDGATVTCSWDYTNTTAAVNLHARAVTWTLDAITAATALGATPFIAAITFSGHEGDTPYMDEATFTTKMVNNLNRYRTLFSDSAIPVVIGSMTPEYGDARGQTYTADIARALPKLPYNAGLSLAAFFYGPRAATKAGEIIHFSSAGQVARGVRALSTLLRARTNRTATLPQAPGGLRAVRSGGRFTMLWDDLWGRVTSIEAEFSKDNGATWVAGTIDPDSRLFASVGAWPWENVRGRVRVLNSGAATTASDWVYTDTYAATESLPSGVKVVSIEGPSSAAISPTHTGAATLYAAFRLPVAGTGAAVANARNADSSRTFSLSVSQPSTDLAQAKVAALTHNISFPAAKAVQGNHVNALTISADGTTVKGYRDNDAAATSTNAGGDIAMTTLVSTQSNGATMFGAVVFLGAEHDAATVAKYKAVVADRYGISVAP